MQEVRPSILITGASGFVGSHLVEAALDAGFDVWAGVRPTSSRQWLTDERINFVELALNSRNQLDEQLRGRRWDYVVHAAGATKAKNEAEFMRTNYEGTRNLVDALIAGDAKPRRFVLMSSLSAEPPTTAYGRSKLRAEDYVKGLRAQLDSVILRPTGVYGPRERDYYLMAKSIKRHIDFAVGFKPQYITFIYVKDLCRATLQALAADSSSLTQDAFALSDGQTYSSRDFSRLLQQEMGVKRVVHITAPLWLLKAVCYVSEWTAHITGRMSALNRDKYNILKQRDWRCDISKAETALGYEPEYGLAEGVAETVAWYKEQKWI